MAVTQHTYTGNGSLTDYAFTFPYLDKSDVQVKLNGATQATTTYSFANATTVRFASAPASGDTIIIFRNTNNDAKKGTFFAGSAIKAEDLNDNFDQILYVAQEVDNNAMSTLGTAQMQGDIEMGKGMGIVFEGATEDAYETRLAVADPTADRTITLPNVTGTAVTTGDSGTVTSAMIADATIVNGDIANTTITGSKLVNATITDTQLATDSVNADKIAAGSVGTTELVNDSVTNAKIADDQIDSEHYVDGSIDTAHIADSQVTTAKLANSAVTTDKLTATGVTTPKIADNAITTAKITDANITTAKIAALAVDATKLASDSVTTAKILNANVTTPKIADANVTEVKLAVNAVSEAKIATSAVTTDKIANDAINANKIAANSVGTSEIVNDAVTVSKIADAELSTLAGMQAATASILAAGTNLTATLAEINTVCDGKTVQTTITDTDASYPTSGAVVDYVAAQIAPLGGLEVIANEDSFPTQPDSGVVISIADAGGIVVNGSGVSTTARTAGNGSDNVTINGFPSTLYSTTLTDNMGLMVSSTGSSNTYTYHKLLGKESDIKTLSDDINDFNNRYRVAGSAPSSDLDEGDLWYDTATDKLKVYDSTSSAWKEVASSGNFYINTISSYSGTGGNSATFNGTAYRFVLSNPGSTAQQHIVSVNGVIQKPNSGTSQPGEGFAIDGSSIIFSAAPATSSDYYIVTIGTAVSIGTPSDNTVATAKIQNGAVTTAKITDDAVTAAKIGVLDAALQLADSTKIQVGGGNDLEVYHDATNSIIDNKTNDLYIKSASDVFITPGTTEAGVYIRHNGAVELYYDNVKKLETASGGVVVAGNVDAGTGNFLTDDNGIFSAGTAGDFQWLHDGSNSYIKNSTGNIAIEAKAGEMSIKCVPDAQVELYYNDALQTKTTSTGLTFADDKRIDFGDSADLKIYHDGSNSYVAESGTGALILGGGAVGIMNAGGTENMIWCSENGSVSLYHDNTKMLETSASGVEIVNGDLRCSLDLAILTDGRKAKFGAGADLEIYHDGSDSYIDETGTGDLKIRSASGIQLQNGSEKYLSCHPDGAVKLYYDDATKVETTSTGTTITGTELIIDAGTGTSSESFIKKKGSYAENCGISFYQGSTTYGNNAIRFRSQDSSGNVINDITIGPAGTARQKLRLVDDAAVEIGTGQDLQLWHNATDTFIKNNTNTLFIDSADEIQLRNTSTEKYIKCINNGAVELYHNNSKKFETTADGGNINGYLSCQRSAGKALQVYMDSTDDVEGSIFRHNRGGLSGYSGKMISFRGNDNTEEGSIVIGTSATAYNESSDYRLKENEVLISDGITRLKTLKPYRFNFKKEPSVTVDGFFAHELTAVPEAIYGAKDAVDSDGNIIKQQIDKSKLVPLLTAALQEAITKIETLETKVAALEAA